MATAVVAAAVAVGAPTASAAPGVPTQLALPGFGDIAVDTAHSQVFISGGPTANSIIVTDLYGLPKKTIDNVPGATGLQLNADGSKLYAALAAGDLVTEIDTVTLAPVLNYIVGPQTCPTHLARSGQFVYYGYGCEGSFTGKIGRIDTVARNHIIDIGGTARFQRAPILAAGTNTGGTVVAGQLSLSQSMLQVYTPNTTTGLLTQGANGDVVGASLTDLAMTPDGNSLYSAAGGRDRVDVITPGTLARSGAYSVRPRPDAVALSPDNGFLAAGALTGDEKDVLVYKVGASVPTKTVTLPEGDVVAARGLAWSTNLTSLYIISQHDNQPQPSLTVVPLATTV